MPKFRGIIGYAETVQTEPGVWEEQITERKHYIELGRNIRRVENSGNVNDDLNVSNEMSIVADPYAKLNFHAMRYVIYMGAKWKIKSVDVQPPRLLLTIGGEYNEQQTEQT